ncbi:hypothetical protein CK203_068592 [Vitis vinifera]|uniref:Endonuclease/exonuclease/phosphatase domain-containing protein n=1 Tax=Vitis vinifera TaxID=29760 RepID=A0A438EEE5_VITVI|nr:hypothetical protein CK203_068592 [Vitis vinifera]
MVSWTPQLGLCSCPCSVCSKRKNRDPVEIDAAAGGSGGFGGVKSANKAVVALAEHVAEDTDSDSVLSSLKILSYNVWFREDLEMDKRMQALGDLIQLHSPDLICFQLLQISMTYFSSPAGGSWVQCPAIPMQTVHIQIQTYECDETPIASVNASATLLWEENFAIAELEVQAGKPLVLATSHLESPCPAPPKWDQMYSKERVDQAKEALNLLTKNPNVIFGDLRPGENGWTYDTKSNQMLSGNRTLQKRLDRFMCRLHDFKISKIDMIGMEPIPGLSYCKEKKVRKEMQQLVLPVLPSDHYGLLLTISSQ